MGDALIKVTQLPVIEERLRAVRDQVEQMAAEAAGMVCTEDTIQAVKSRRAELRRQLDELEEQRKAVKRAVMAPYDAFEAVYKDCITLPFRRADEALKGKIASVEDEQKRVCEMRCREYFDELLTVHGVHWLKYEQAGLKISLTEAKKRTPSGCFDKLNEFVARVACDLDSIGDDADALAEYKGNGLSLAAAIKTISDRRRAIAEEKASFAQRQEFERRQQEAVRRVEAALPPPVVVEEKPPEPVLTVAFRATATREKLVALREFMKKEEISYE